MSEQVCPACLSPKLAAGRCTQCGFSMGEYKAPPSALAMGSMVGKYRIGILKASSRQAQIYTAIHNETSATVLLEEFLPATVAGRIPGATEVVLASNEPEYVQRYQQGCLLYEASMQNRPLRRVATMRENNTVYSVFEPFANASISAQAEALADHPVFFRDTQGKPQMTINLLKIPPMPKERTFNPEQYLEQGPTTEGVDDASPLAEHAAIPPAQFDLTTKMNPMSIEPSADGNKRAIKKWILIGGIALAVVILAVVLGIFLTRKPPAEPFQTPIPLATEEEPEKTDSWEIKPADDGAEDGDKTGNETGDKKENEEEELTNQDEGALANNKGGLETIVNMSNTSTKNGGTDLQIGKGSGKTTVDKEPSTIKKPATTKPTNTPTTKPTNTPTTKPTNTPTTKPDQTTDEPTAQPTGNPTNATMTDPTTAQPSKEPEVSETENTGKEETPLSPPGSNVPKKDSPTVAETNPDTVQGEQKETVQISQTTAAENPLATGTDLS